MVDPMDGKMSRKSAQPVKLLSVDGLKKALRFSLFDIVDTISFHAHL